jgi:hypothetical protein
MTDYTTTRRRKVAFPSREFVQENPVRAAKILAHEYVHLIDWEDHPILMPLLYVAPQVLALTALSAILSVWFGKWFLLGLVGALFLLPWPALFRAHLEVRGYAMSMAFNIWRHGSLLPDTKEWIAEKFADWGYYRMWPNKKDVMKWLEVAEQRIRNIDAVKVPANDVIFTDSEAFLDVYSMVTGIEFDDNVEED